MRTHYPRTPHLPWSPGAAPDDVRVGDLSGLIGHEVVVTEKLDGENTTLYRDGLHARSLDSAHHPSRAWIKALHGRIADALPVGWRLCGENMFARHSVPYDNLASWFYGFSVWAGQHCLDWDSTVRFCHGLGVPVPPVLWRGVFTPAVPRSLRIDPTRQEGYVVRTVAGFDRADFAARVAKWVRPAHVQTDQHWMLAPVVANGRGPAAALWEVRSGAPARPAALLAALGLDPGDTPGDTPGGYPGAEAAGVAAEPAGTAIADVASRLDLLDLLGRRGDARLAGVLAALLPNARRGELAARLVVPLGMALARRVADLVGLRTALYRPVPDEARRAGLVRLAEAADLGVLHAVAAVLADGAEAREQVDWSELYAQEAGLLATDPLEPLRHKVSEALAGFSADVADRCWAQTRDGYARGRVSVVEQAVAATWRWRDGGFPRLVVMVGPAGSGKSGFAAGLPGVDRIVSMDDLRTARGSRADQRGNAEVLHESLGLLDAELTGERTVVWDATGLDPGQRARVQAVARRRDALVTYAVALVDAEELVRRNGTRAHPVPPAVLAAQIDRFRPPYPYEAHRVWYIGPGGTVDDTAGALHAVGPAGAGVGAVAQPGAGVR